MCKLVIDGRGTQRDQFVKENDPIVTKECSPVEWYGMEKNCDLIRVDDHSCIGDKANSKLADLVLDGTQSCPDAAAGINLKFGPDTSYMDDECALRTAEQGDY